MPPPPSDPPGEWVYYYFGDDDETAIYETAASTGNQIWVERGIDYANG